MAEASQKSICCSLIGDVFCGVFYYTPSLYIYERKVSPFFCTHDLTSSIDAGRLYVEQKNLVN
jgi:hypothetical protein